MAGCDDCAAGLVSIRRVTDGADWQDSIMPARAPTVDVIAQAREIVTRDTAARERAQSNAAWISSLAAQSRIAQVVLHEELVTPALAWRLVEVADQLRFADPKDALSLYEVAAFIADTAANRGTLLSHELRIEVWKNYAWLLAYQGCFDRAEAAIEWALDAADQCSSSRHMRAIVVLTRGIVLSQMERWSEALLDVALARREFEEFGDEARRIKALEQEANILMRTGDLPGAILRLSSIVELEADDMTKARRYTNIAIALESADAIWAAGEYMAKAKEIYILLGAHLMTHQATWGLARIVAKGNRIGEALETFASASAGFRTVGAVDSAIRVDLDWSECEIEHRAMTTATYDRLRIAATYAVDKNLPVAKCRALFYLQTLGHTATTWHIQRVRDFLAHADAHPQAQFIAPEWTA